MKKDEVMLYNTMSRSLERFEPLCEDRVGIYTCGPTVYNYAHIGNLRTFMFEDVLKKTLKMAGYDVYHVMNITDVGHLSGDGDDGEDKVEREAKREKKTIKEIVDFYTNAFLGDMKELNIEMPSAMPKASEHIKEMLEIIAALEKKGHTYTQNGNVYFSIDTYPEYGALARLDLSKLQEGKRVGVDKSKKNPHDFVLWFTKSKFENQAMKWDSPYGVGYPGWHLECSAMSKKYLGESFDIHCGGVDAIPVHHTNEIAQSECASGKRMAKYWMHSEFLLSEKGKMSKSTGDFMTLSSLKDKSILPLAYRYFCLQSHYRKQLQFSFDALKGADTALRSIYRKVDELRLKTDSGKSNKEELSLHTQKFKKALYNDLNTSVALAEVHAVLSDSQLSASDALEFLSLADSVLSLSFLAKREKITIPENIISLAKKRADAKASKDYKSADAIRADILALGYEIKDSKDGFEIIPCAKN